MKSIFPYVKEENVRKTKTNGYRSPKNTADKSFENFVF